MKIFFSWIDFFTQRLTLRRIRRSSDAYDNPLTSCSIPYTDLRAIIMNWILKRWQNSWDQQINSKLLVIHSFIGKMLCSYGQQVLTRCRTDHGGVAHRYVLNNECPECIPPHSNYSLKHILIICVDVVESRQTYYNVNNLSDFAYECCRWHHFEICRSNWFECYNIDKYIHSKYMVLSF